MSRMAVADSLSCLYNSKTPVLEAPGPVTLDGPRAAMRVVYAPLKSHAFAPMARGVSCSFPRGSP